MCWTQGSGCWLSYFLPSGLSILHRLPMHQGLGLEDLWEVESYQLTCCHILLMIWFSLSSGRIWVFKGVLFGSLGDWLRTWGSLGKVSYRGLFGLLWNKGGFHSSCRTAEFNTADFLQVVAFVSVDWKSLSCLQRHAADQMCGLVPLQQCSATATKGTRVKAGLFFSGAHPEGPGQVCFLCSGCLVSVRGNGRQIRLKLQGCCSRYCCHRNWQK